MVTAKVIDSTHLELSSPIETCGGDTVLVSVAQSGEQDYERLQWLAASAEAFQSGYGESEPDYPLAMVRESNLEYAP